MAIETAMIVSGATAKRTETPINAVAFFIFWPGNGYYALINKKTNRANSIVSPDALPVGLLLFDVGTPSTNGIASLYVVVQLDGYKFLVRVRIATFYIDPRTGQRWDPTSAFYNPMAS